MATKSAAAKGDVSATAGTSPYTGANSGTWTAGPVSETSYANLKSGGKEVVWKAECTFAFTGASSSGATVTGTEKVTLRATAKLLMTGEHHVLVDGDSKTGGDSPPSFDNKLSASAAGPLQTA